jgi:hypothetical protein
VRRHSSFLVVAALTVLAPSLATAQAYAPPAQAEPQAETPVVPPVASPTLESLQADLRQLEARHEEELKALRDDLARRDEEAAVAQERDAVERERLLRVYGFADVGIMRNIAPKDGILASQFTTPLTFYLGRLNLYYDVRPDPDFRFLAETRVSLYPNGTSSGVNSTGQVQRTTTLVSDVSSPNSATSVAWGSIILERAALDWTRYPLLSVRAGLFLTPFGIYNVDHGTPALITMALPTYIGQGWIPERQLGLQVFGSLLVERWELGYALTFSNGRTDGVLDVGDSKAWGGRLFAKRQGELSLRLGASALYQPYRRDVEQYGMDSTGTVTYQATRVVERQGLTLGNDISLDYGGLRVRNELVLFKTEYTPGKRDAPAQARGGLAPDSTQINWTFVAAYRWWKAEPFFQVQYFLCSPTQAIATEAWSPGAGFNVYLRANVILKGAWTHPRFYKDNDPQGRASRQNFHTFAGMLTWAF